ncbi:MAG: hypothetical protein GPJ29_07075 [Microcystis aeruginosa BK11-02]|nr:hypothetical protein [Microcystis aeruginosa BK11-02]
MASRVTVLLQLPATQILLSGVTATPRLQVEGVGIVSSTAPVSPLIRWMELSVQLLVQILPLLSIPRP